MQCILYKWKIKVIQMTLVETNSSTELLMKKSKYQTKIFYPHFSTPKVHTVEQIATCFSLFAHAFALGCISLPPSPLPPPASDGLPFQVTCDYPYQDREPRGIIPLENLRVREVQDAKRKVLGCRYRWYGTAQHNIIRHGTARHGTARHGTARHGAAQYDTAQHSMARHGTARHSVIQHSIIQLQHSMA